jgi:digeranylgeranylglycerophospholipid reductase
VRRARITIVCDGRDALWEPESLETQKAAEAGYILERRVFDRVLAENAAEAGARVLVKTAVVGLNREGSRVVGVQARGPWGERSIAASVVIGADGVESRIGTWAGLNTALPPSDLMTCAQFLLAGIDIDPECMYFYLDQECAPGGYVWIFPKGHGRANVGLGMQADLARQPPIELLTRFVERRAFLAQGSIVTMIVGGVPVGVPRGPIVTDGCLLVGDAARQVDPLTGGGIAHAMAAGRLAAGVVSEAIAAGDVTGRGLSPYEGRWRADIGRRMERHYWLRAKFGPEERLSERFLRVFALSSGAGL